MFRKINAEVEPIFKFILYKNRHEKLMEIPNEYIKKMTVSYEDINTIELSIPKYITDKTEQRVNRLYTLIKPRQQIIVESYDSKKQLLGRERYTIDTPKSSTNKNTGTKSYTAHSFEATLDHRRVSFSGNFFQLKNDSEQIADGILDLFVRENPDWSIGTVDDKSRREVSKAMEVVNVDLFSNLTTGTIAENGLIWEKDVTTTIADGKPLYLNIQYTHMKTYSDGIVLKDDSLILNSIDSPLPKNITKIQAYHYSEAGNRYGIKYVFTLSDSTQIIRTCVFTNVINKTITCEKVVLAWETGNLIEYNNIKYVTLDTSSSSWYKFLRDVQDQFTSVFLFDSYNKTISVIHRDDIGEESPFQLTYDNSIINIEITENSDYISGLNVLGKNNLSIAGENIYGGNIIYNFDWYKSNGIMSDELIENWNRYEAFLTTKTAEWQTLKDEYMTVNQRWTVTSSELQSLSERLKAQKSLLVAFISAKNAVEQAKVKDEITSIETAITNAVTNLASYTATMQGFQDQMALIGNEVKRENATDSQGKIFTTNDILELGDIELIKDYQDDYYTTEYSLYQNSKSVLADLIKPQVDFKISVANLCKVIQNPQGWNKILTEGNWFRLNIDDIDVKQAIGEDSVRLTGFEFYPSLKDKNDKVDNLIFTNKTKKVDKNKFVDDIGRRTADNTSVSNSFNQIKEDSINTNNYCKNLIDGVLDASATSVRGRTSSNIMDISNAGIFLYDSTDTNKACYIGSGLYCLTLDGFKTTKVAITPDGLVAEMVAGKLLLGNKLLITNDNGSFTIEGTGLTIRDGDAITGKERVFLGIDSVTGLATLKLIGKNSGELCLSEEGVISTNQYPMADNLDSSHPMIIPFRAMEGITELKKVILTLFFDKYRAFETGASSGGTTIVSSTTSESGGGGTTSSGGSYSNTVTSDATGWTEYFGVDGDYDSSVQYPSSDGSGNHYHHIIHNHNVIVNPHHHNVYISVPSHTHYVSPHSHSVSISVNTAHTHHLIYGIYEDTKPSNCSIYINDILIVSNINGTNDYAEIDITSHLELNKMNIIKITSDTNGRFVANLCSKYLQQW